MARGLEQLEMIDGIIAHEGVPDERFRAARSSAPLQARSRPILRLRPPMCSSLLAEWRPRLLAFLGRRLHPRDPWGLRATAAGLVVLVGIWFFLGVLEDLVGKDPLVTIDLRLHNTVPLIRSAATTRVMLLVTEFGSAGVLSLLCVGIALVALSHGRRRLAATFLVAIAGTGLLSTTVKALVGYVRPSDAIVAASEASFPSGHVLSGAVVYGLLAALLLGGRGRRGTRAVGVTLLLLLVVGIALSRLYLGVHWPSDVLGSLALALVCLALLLFFLHHAPPLSRIDTFRLPVSPRTLRAAGVAGLVAAAVTAALLALSAPIVAARPAPALRPVELASLLAGLPPDLPRRSEDLAGGPIEPVSLVLIGSEEELLRGFSRAGWTRADRPTPGRVAAEALATLANREDPSAPAMPTYLADQPQAFTFQKPDPAFTGNRHQHDARVWQTTYCVPPACRPLWLATASFDVGVGLSSRPYVPTRRVVPRIDQERLVVRDLRAAGAAEVGTITVPPPTKGTHVAGATFVTDGRAVLLVLPGA